MISNSDIFTKFADLNMKETKGNIFAIFDDILQREDKEKLLNQKSKVVWMTRGW